MPIRKAEDVFIVDTDVHADDPPAALAPYCEMPWRRALENMAANYRGYYAIPGYSPFLPTQKLAESLGIDHYFAEVLPQDKAQLIEQLQEKGKSVCFVGDGINDSIALKKANVSISLCGASTIATDTAGIILMDGRFASNHSFNC